MLKLAIIFFVLSSIAGFSGIPTATAGIAGILFFIALAIVRDPPAADRVRRLDDLLSRHRAVGVLAG